MNNLNTFLTQPDSNDLSHVLQMIRHFCSYQERCLKEVESKLNHWKVQPKKIPAIINQLQKENYLNEERFARSFAGGKFRNNKWGRQKIEFELFKRGVPELLIQEGLLEIDEEEYGKTLKEIITRKKNEIKPVETVNIREKIINFAYGKGYEIDLILGIVKELKI
jgi:regulatory protein